ncbi:MAG: hypothetical protein ACOC5B_02020 [Myxococcota bacterium]
MIERWTMAIVILGVASCAQEGATEGAATTAEPAEPAAGAEQPAGPPQPWEDMTFEERKDHMKLAVLPAMENRFQEFDPDAYADFGCESCHGEDPEGDDFAMPNSDLPVLPSPESSEWTEMTSEPSSVVHFMMEDVVPDMATLLGEPTFDPETGEGFGCLDCHTTEDPD